MLLNLSWYGVVICQPFKLCASSGCDHFIIIELVISHKQYSALCGLEGRSAETSGFPDSSVTSYFLAVIQVSCSSVSGVRQAVFGMTALLLTLIP